MTVKNGQVPHLPNEDENNTLSSPTPELKRGEALAKRIHANSQALLAALSELAQVGDGIVDDISDVDEDVKARLEEFNRNLAEMKNLSREELIQRMKAYVEAPDLLTRVRARLQAEEQRKKNDAVLRQFGQENHTSIN